MTRFFRILSALFAVCLTFFFARPAYAGIVLVSAPVLGRELPLSAYLTPIHHGSSSNDPSDPSGWFFARGWRYRSESGHCPSASWEWIDGDRDGMAECYYFDASGRLVLDTCIDGYTLDERGRWCLLGVVQTRYDWNMNGWDRWNGMDSYFLGGYKARNYITPDNRYVDDFGELVRDCRIPHPELHRQSMGGAAIAVNKTTHVLELWLDGELSRSYVITSGGVRGDKEIRGDRKTPEGSFFVCQKVPNSSYTRGLLLNYPNGEDAERGLAAGLISSSQYRSILQAEATGSTPPFDTALGGYIEIHGARDPEDNSSGCIELLNEEMEELYALTPAGAYVLILP